MQTTMIENVLHGAQMDPWQNQPEILGRLTMLVAGECFTLQTDQDPGPLYDQLLGERSNVFTWEYLENGPECWKVRVTRRAGGNPDETLGQIVSRDLRKADVLKRYSLDFCCGGKKTLREACAEAGLDLDMVQKDLQHADRMPALRPLQYGDWSLDFLSDYIVNTHHTYVRKSLPELRAYAGKVFKVHSDRHPELARIFQLVEEINEELSAHLVDEENILFPYVKELLANGDGVRQLARHGFETVLTPINTMEAEHEQAGECMLEIRSLTNNYQLPDDACGSYAMLYRLLEEFEEDLHLHIHLENNILFPKALEIEKQLQS